MSEVTARSGLPCLTRLLVLRHRRVRGFVPPNVDRQTNSRNGGIKDGFRNRQRHGRRRAAQWRLC